MKRIYNALVVLGLLNASLCFATSSTSISLPTQQTAATAVTVVVTHITRNNIGYNHSVSCPTATQSSLFNGLSPIKDATLIGNDKFYPNGPTYWSNGYVVYNCSETYWSNDPYYMNLVNNTTYACQAGAYLPETCTLKGRNNNYMLGVLPIHFVIVTPGQTMVRNDHYSNYNRVAYMAPASNPIINGTLSSYAPGGSAQEFSFIPPNIPGQSYTVNLMWQVIYSQSDGAGNGYTTGGSGNDNNLARCPDYSSFPTAGYTTIAISNDMLGKTCQLSCNEGVWNRYGPTGAPNDSATTATTVYFGAPLIVSCH